MTTGANPDKGVTVGPNPAARAAVDNAVRAFLRERLQGARAMSEHHSFEGRVVLVTGASKGIGFACAEAFARAGAAVAIVSRSRENLDAALARLAGDASAPSPSRRTCAIPKDAARAVDEAEAALGPIDVLVNSAGAAKRYAPAELTAQAWRDAMDAKFFSYIFPTDIVVKRMAARGRGAIVNIIGMGGKVASADASAGRRRRTPR